MSPLPSVLWATAWCAVLASAAAVAGTDAASSFLQNRYAGRPVRGLHRVDVGNASLLAGILAPRAAAAAGTTNLQPFTGAVAGVAAPAVAQSNDATRPFAVAGDTFNDFASAGGRSCDNQHNACADAVNSQKPAGVQVSDCDTQNTQCKAAVASATQTAFTELVTSTDEFDIFCDL